MSSMSPQEFAQQIGAGLLSFPVTHFTQDAAFDVQPYRQHIAWLLEHKPAGLFAAGGTGEFFSLTLDEFAAGRHRRGRGDRRPRSRRRRLRLRHRHRQASSPSAAEAAGADGILLLPPYLVNAEQAGLAAHVEAVCAVHHPRRHLLQPRQRHPERVHARHASATAAPTSSASRTASATSN